MIVSQSLLKWYRSNKRYLPWRETKNPYYIWLSEIILQQTRVNQGFAYYKRFIEKYPSLNELSNATPEDVLLLWQGLGYYSRARNVHKAARILTEKYSGKFPQTYDKLLALPGIGEYTAGAIASLAFDQPVVAIDGNVHRVLARYVGIDSSIHSSKGKTDFRNAAEELLDRNNPGEHNQAMIELGALICLPVNPKCNECPIIDGCFANKSGRISDLPLKSKKSGMHYRYFFYIVLTLNNKIVLKQRPENDIWALLYDFPLIERSKPIPLKALIKSQEWKAIFRGSEYKILAVSPTYKHVLSHQIIFASFVEVEIMNPVKLNAAIEINMEDISRYPLPRLIDKYFSERLRER
jgi:A/G-specific adenine glycosylase